MPTRRQLQQILAALGVLIWIYLVAVYVARAQVWWLSPIAVLAAMYLADAASGVAHFVVDYTPTVQGVGLRELFEYPGDKGSRDYIDRRNAAMKAISGFQEVVFDFKVHHLSPSTLGRRSAAHMILPVVVYAALPLTVLVGGASELGFLANELALFLLVLIGCGTVSQYAHACTHKLRPPRWARWLQTLRLFLPPQRHEVHHTHPDRSFCLLNGWANPLVDRVFRLIRRRGYFPDSGLSVR